MLSVLAWVDFHARSRFARSIIPEEKWGTTRNLGCGAITFSNYEMSLSSPLLFLAVFVFFDFFVVFNPRQETLISSVLKP